MCSCTCLSLTHPVPLIKKIFCFLPFNKYIYIAPSLACNCVICHMLSSQALVLATAMAVSAATVILFDLFKDKYFSNQDICPPDTQISKPLKSCFVSYSGGKKSDRAKKKRRVRFAEDVKDSDKNVNGHEVYDMKEQRKLFGEVQGSCGNEMVGVGIQKMPANHVALYSGILRDRVHRMQHSH